MIRKLFLFIIISWHILFAATLHITPKQAEYIAQKVWQNEGAGKDKYLVWWNDGEDFASLGIGHFIWFPKGHTERFREVFPMVVAFMQQRGVTMPSWLTPQSDFPWKSKAALMWAKKVKSTRYRELFAFLKRTMSQQAAFMAERTRQALPQILATIDNPQKAAIIQRRFEKMLYHKDGSVDERGLYILIDYTNFKGEGTLESERYRGQGWGLLQVLEHFDEHNPDKYRAFADAAKAILSRRIENSPPARGEERWRRGWFKRLDGYWK